jgi:peptidyl-prolyl cis-trans isomerase C
MMKSNSRILLASALSLLVLSACNSEDKTKAAAAPAPAAAVKEAAAATVNGIAIAKSRVEMIVKQALASGQQDSEELRKSIIDKLAMQTLIAEEAVKKGLDKSADVMDQIDLTRQSILANAYVQDLMKNSAASEEALKAEYEKIKATITGTEYRARHILVEKEAEAKDIIAKLKKDPGLFEKLAMEKSKDTGSKAKGGELGWFDLSRMVPEFGAAASKLDKGAITQEPVKTQFGYHVIQLEDSRPIEAPPFEDVKPQLAQHLQQQTVQKQMEELKAKAKIEMAGAPAPAAAPAAPAPAPAPAAK